MGNGQQIVTLPVVKFGASSLKRLWTGHKTVDFNMQKSVNFDNIQCSLLYLQNFPLSLDFSCTGFLLVWFNFLNIVAEYCMLQTV